jgi:hypothetical protein
MRALLGWLRRHSWALASLAMASPAAAQIIPGGRGSGIAGVSGSISAENPWAGRIVFITDDTRDWIYDNLLDSLRVVNADSGLTNTPWELHWNVGVNTGILSDTSDNGIADFRGQAADEGCGGYDCRMTLDQIAGVYGSGLVEICGHGGRHLAFDEYSTQSEWVKPFGMTDSSAMEWGAADPYIVMRDSLGITLHSFVTPFHRISDQGLQVLSKYYRNIRTGGVWYPTGQASADTLIFPTDDNATGNGTPAWRRGTGLQLNKPNQDALMYAMSRYDPRAQQLWGPWYNGPRITVPHESNLFATPIAHDSAAVATNFANIKWVLDFVAENKGFGIITFHDQERTTPSIVPDLYDERVTAWGGDTNLSGDELGMVGVTAILRYAAGLARNGALGRDGPKLIVSKFDDAMNARLGLSYLDGPVDTIDNPFLKPPASTPLNPLCHVPYGFFYDLGYDSTGTTADGAWGDSSWAYYTPAQVVADGGWIGYAVNDGAAATATDSLYTPGVWATTTSSGNFKSLVLAGVPVIPGSRAHFSVYGSTSHVWNKDGDTTPTDSLSACYLNIIIKPYFYQQDPTDSTSAWMQQAFTTASDAGPVVPLQTGSPWSTGYQSNITTWLTGQALSEATSGYAIERHLDRFHMRDQWSFMRTSGYTSTMYTDGASATTDASQRWRQFEMDADIPPHMTMATVIIQPVGWNAAAACSLEVTKPMMICYPR